MELFTTFLEDFGQLDLEIHQIKKREHKIWKEVGRLVWVVAA
jgi:hypothetical protein